MTKSKIKRPRRSRSDSASAAVEAVEAALSVIDPPEGVNISEVEHKFWRRIIGSRAAGSWTENDLMMAAMLARCYSDIEKYSLALSSSRLIKDERGNPKISPAHKIVDDLYKQALSLSRTLQIHPRATQGESRDQTKRNDLYSSKLEAIKNLDDEDNLIPGLH